MTVWLVLALVFSVASPWTAIAAAEFTETADPPAVDGKLPRSSLPTDRRDFSEILDVDAGEFTCEQIDLTKIARPTGTAGTADVTGIVLDESGKAPRLSGGKACPPSQVDSTPAVKHRADRPTVAIALGGGGIRGATHIGVLRVLEREKIPVDCIVGTSMGAIVGSLYAAGVSLDKIEELLTKQILQDSYAPRPLVVQIFVKSIMSIFYLFLKKPYAGIYSGEGLEELLEDVLPDGKRRIEQLNIPFFAVVTNLCDGNVYKFSRGSVSKAVRASASIPVFVRPVEIDKGLFVDGSLRTSIPTRVARTTGADIIIGIQSDCQLQAQKPKKFRAYEAVFDQMVNTVMAEISAIDRRQADLTIWPDLKGISMFSKDSASVRRAIAAGERSAEEALPEIKKLLSRYPKSEIETGAKPGSTVQNAQRKM